jgi:hypothetical protein
MGCGNHNAVDQPIPQVNAENSTKISEKDNSFISKEKKDAQKNTYNPKKYEFTIQNDTVVQILNFSFLNKDTIKFDLIYKYKKYNYHIKDLAVLKKYTFDGESISTEKGELFFVNEYISTFEKRPLVISVEENFKLAVVSIHDELGIKNDIFRDDIIMYLAE